MAREQIQTSVKDDAAGNITEIDYHSYLDTNTVTNGATTDKMLVSTNGKLGYKDIVNVYDGLDASSYTLALSARQGRILNEEKTDNDFYDSQNIRHIIGKNVTSMQISDNQKYAFTNCWGGVAYKYNNTFYISNSPNLTVSGKNSSNWQNIWVDGMASSPDGTVTKWQDGQMKISGRAVNKTFDTTPSFTVYLPISFLSSPFVTIASYSDLAIWSLDASYTDRLIFRRDRNAYYCNYLAVGRWK